MNIEEITRDAGKTYDFHIHEDHKKPAQYWFQNPPEGLTLFIVFYTLACRWSKCLGCNLPSRVSKNHVPFIDIMAQIDFLFNSILSGKQKNDM